MANLSGTSKLLVEGPYPTSSRPRHCAGREALVKLPGQLLQMGKALVPVFFNLSSAVSAPARTEQNGNGQGDTLEAELKGLANGQDVTLVPQDVTR
jgi:hypothetical protein